MKRKSIHGTIIIITSGKTSLFNKRSKFTRNDDDENDEMDCLGDCKAKVTMVPLESP